MDVGVVCREPEVDVEGRIVGEADWVAEEVRDERDVLVEVELPVEVGGVGKVDVEIPPDVLSLIVAE